jgi:hypothetical protein
VKKTPAINHPMTQASKQATSQACLLPGAALSCAAAVAQAQTPASANVNLNINLNLNLNLNLNASEPWERVTQQSFFYIT